MFARCSLAVHLDMKRLLREVKEDLAVPGLRKMALEDHMDFGYHGFRQSIGSLPYANSRNMAPS